MEEKNITMEGKCARTQIEKKKKCKKMKREMYFSCHIDGS